jgi:hypothetical protein
VVNSQIKTPTIVKGKEDPPKFEGSKQAKMSDDSSKPTLFVEAELTQQLELDLRPWQPQLELFDHA